MRPAALIALALAVAPACGWFHSRSGRATAKPTTKEQTSGGSEWSKPAVPPEIRAKHLAERFPGARTLSLVKLLAWPEPRQGACWSEVPPPDDATIIAKYALTSGSTRDLSGAKALLDDGWLPVYRSPQGKGLERRSEFSAIDLSFTTELRCRCSPQGKLLEGESKKVRVRLRWSSGGTPEVSGRLLRGDKNEGLLSIRVFGGLVTHDFPVQGTFPNATPGICGGHVALTLLVEPPIL